MRALTIDLVFYFLITAAGYMSTLGRTKDLIIDREPPSEGTDILMTISQIMICVSLSIGIPLNYVPVRSAVFEQFFADPKYTFGR